MIRRKKAAGKKLHAADKHGRTQEMRHGSRHVHTWLSEARCDPRSKTER